MPAEGGEALQVTRGGGFVARESWDGATLYYFKFGISSTSETGLWKMPVNGGEETQVLGASLDDFRNWEVSVSGIYYLTSPTDQAPTPNSMAGFRTTYTLHFLDFETGEKTVLFQRQGVTQLNSLAVSPDEKRLLFAEWPTQTSELVLVENFR